MNPNPLSIRNVRIVLVNLASQCSNTQHFTSPRQPSPIGEGHRSLELRPLVASYFDDRFLTDASFRTSVGDMSIRLGRGCSWAMCVERRLVATRSPQNRQRALPGEMWTRCIPNSMSGSLFARQEQAGAQAPVVGKWLFKTSLEIESHCAVTRYLSARSFATAPRWFHRGPP
jgi:hypothetical protein